MTLVYLFELLYGIKFGSGLHGADLTPPDMIGILKASVKERLQDSGTNKSYSLSTLSNSPTTPALLLSSVLL